MVKIKQKKTMNLPQLIEWALKNGIKNTYFVSKNRYIVTFDKIGFLESGTLPLDEIFTVEVEEEITEDTEFELLIEITNSYPNCLWEKASVEDWKDEDSKEFHAYIDGEFKLIWRNGKLVE